MIARNMPNSSAVIQSIAEADGAKPALARVRLAHAHATASESERAEAAVAGGEAFHRLGQRRAAEIRPQRVEEQKLGIGRLPEQEVGQPVLAAGADHQVGLRQRAGEKALAANSSGVMVSGSSRPSVAARASSRAAAAISSWPP